MHHLSSTASFGKSEHPLHRLSLPSIIHVGYTTLYRTISSSIHPPWPHNKPVKSDLGTQPQRFVSFRLTTRSVRLPFFFKSNSNGRLHMFSLFPLEFFSFVPFLGRGGGAREGEELGSGHLWS